MGNIFLNKDIQKFVDDLERQGGKPLYELTPDAARQVLITAQSGPVSLPAVHQETQLITVNNRDMNVVFVRPDKQAHALPIIFYIHGGGWVMGNEVTHRRLICELAARTNSAVVFPVYANAPAGQYPFVTEDLYAVLEHVTGHAKKYGLDEARLIVMGDSVGGNMAAVMTLMAKAKGKHPRITSQILLYPVTDDNFETESYETYADGPWLTRAAMKWFWDMYAPRAKDRNNITACPLKATKEALADLPPALIVTVENDVLRDEGEAYARKLNAAGVEVASVRVNGAIHDFMMLNALADTAPARGALDLVCAYIMHVFNGRS